MIKKYTRAMLEKDLFLAKRAVMELSREKDRLERGNRILLIHSQTCNLNAKSLQIALNMAAKVLDLKEKEHEIE